MTAKCPACGLHHPDAFTAAKCDNARRLGLKLKTALTLHVVEDEPGETIEEAVRKAAERRGR